MSNCKEIQDEFTRIKTKAALADDRRRITQPVAKREGNKRGDGGDLKSMLL
jgi:hypothetical protein